jgi:hypothetical protein
MSSEDLWVDDVLGRKEDALYLQKYIVSRFSNKKNEPGFVMAINADWGFGKSFMLSRWKRQAENDGHPAIFFDAWQSDFTTDPLLAFIAEMDVGLKRYFDNLPVGKRLSRAAIDKVRKVWKPVLMVLGSAALKHGAGLSISEFSNLVSDETPSHEDEPKKFDTKELQKNLVAAVEKALKNHLGIKQAILEFKKKLSELILVLEESSSVQLPLIIFIDELDRCRPDYAIELLEGIKHLFGVPGVFFVVSTNVKQLGESVKAIYGTGFDGERYLKRFFDLQYSLKEPDHERFAKWIFGNSPLPILQNIIYGFDQVRTVEHQEVAASTPINVFSYIFKKYADAFGLGLRDLQQISIIIESSLIAVNFQRVHPFFLIFLAVIFHKDQELFLRMSQVGLMPSAEQLANIGYRPDLAKIDFRYHGDDGQSRKASTELTEIARLYISVLKSEGFDSHVRTGGYVFPNNLIDYSSKKSLNGKFSTEFSGYFSMIKHAGNFSA